MKTQVAVIGVGYLGRHHARILSSLEDVRLVCVVDADQERADQFAADYDCMAFTDHHEALKLVDAVTIVTPTTYHHKIAMDCIRAGKDVLIEKPITTTVAEADEIISEAARCNVIVQVGHLERFNPAVVALKDMLQEPLFIESDRLAPFQPRGTDVDVTLDLMIHDIDIVTSLIPDARITDIRVVGSRVMTDKVDFAKAWIDFEGGIGALVTASRVSDKKQRTLRIYQKESILLLDYQEMKIVRYFRKGSSMETEIVVCQEKEPLKEELMDFIACIREKRIPRVTAVEGRNALEVALRISENVH